MKAKSRAKPEVAQSKPNRIDPIGAYGRKQTRAHSGICAVLRTEIDTALPKATSRIWHAIPVWFIGENPVVGYKATPKYVNLLFWNGQALGEPALQAAGKFHAAQIKFTAKSEIAAKDLRRWLKKAGKEIWDFRALLKSRSA